MRELKFRVRDTKNNKWVDAVPSLEYLLDDGDHSISHHDIDEESGIYTYPKNITGDTFNGRLVWQQYTGLKDKNGKEIYEGDIVSGICLNDGPQICVVGFDTFGIFYTKIKFYPCEEWDNVAMLAQEHNEIIGNIFENPELLK
jgi:uncharacterized phage protein (TIGR01671 family)